MSYPVSSYPQQQPYQQPGYPQPGYPQPGYPNQYPQGAYPPPQTVIIVQQPMGPQFNWHSGECDMCAEPGGIPLCCYVSFCHLCAAGDVAEAAGRSYICSCLIAPLLSHALQHDQNWIEACSWAMDRVALTNKYGIVDPLGQGPCSTAYFCFACGCHYCLLFQELNHIKAVSMGLAPSPPGFVPMQKVMG